VCFIDNGTFNVFTLPGGVMTPKLRNFLIGLFSVLIIMALVVGVVGLINVRRSFPMIEGEIKISSVEGLSTMNVQGIESPVDIYRDQMGIPHIYASNLHDLFFAQGYVHAQDRFWQMDFWRHIGSARLSEMFGDSQVETDAFLRTLGWRQIAEMEWENLSPESKAILLAYAEGINAYLADHSGTELSLEYGVLKLINPDYVVEPWTPVNSLTWGKAMAWDLRGNMDEEIERSILLKTLTPEQVDELFPPYPSDHPIIVPSIGDFTNSSAPRIDHVNAMQSILKLSNLENIKKNFTTLDSVLGPSGSEIGSNNWAVSGSLTVSGKPLLANDPHLSIQMPSIWYQIGLHCKPKSDACPYEVGGFSFAGVPGVIIGHNDQIAWAVTNVGPDVMDLYIEKVNPENPNQYQVNGEWVDMVLRQETIKVAGGDPVTITVRATRHGPVVSDTYGPLLQTIKPEEGATPVKPYTEQAGIPLPDPYVVSLRWTALEPGSVFEAIWGFDKAKNWDEFREAARGFEVPAQNLLYADTAGNIAYQMPGKIPVRKNGDGRLPVPGWTDEYEWTGYIPFEELPYQVNPTSGYIVTANNQVPPNDYPNLISTDWDYGFRAARIVELIENAPGPIDTAYFQKLQGDNKNLNAETIVPLLMQLKVEDIKLDNARNVLTGWDYMDTMESRQAAFFERFWWFLLIDTFNDQLPENYAAAGGNRWYEVIREVVNQPDSAWWDDVTTADKVESRDDIFTKALVDAVENLNKYYGSDPAKWPAWGELHTSTFRNTTLGESGIAPIEGLFNRGPFPTAGGASIVNATGWDAGESFEVTWLPSMRMIVDLSDLNKSVTVHTTGQSGHAYSDHYIDMADLWRNIQYYAMWWDEQSIIDNSEGQLKLVP
jgi:penicillin amidase